MLNSVGQMLCQIPPSPQTCFKEKSSEWWNINYGGLAHMKMFAFMCQYCLLGIGKIILKTCYCMHGVCAHSFIRDSLVILLGTQKYMKNPLNWRRRVYLCRKPFSGLGLKLGNTA